MKKVVLSVILLLGALSASAIIPFDKYSINREDLPVTAQEMLNEHFPKAKVSMIKVDRHLLKKADYDVKLTNGTKIEFNNKGKWTLVDCKKKSVPETLIPKNIKSNAERKYPGEKIIRIRRSSLYYTVGLKNGKNLKYDLLGIFQGEITPQEVEALENEAVAETDSVETDIPLE